MLEDVKNRRRDPRTISARERRAALVLLSDGAQTQAELAALFGTTIATIKADVMAIRRELGESTSKWSPQDAVGYLARAAERCYAGAIRNDQFADAWAVSRDFVRSLRELGMFKDEDARGGVRITLEVLEESHRRASKALADALDPRVTGEVVDVVARELPPALPLRESSGRDEEPLELQVLEEPREDVVS